MELLVKYLGKIDVHFYEQNGAFVIMDEKDVVGNPIFLNASIAND